MLAPFTQQDIRVPQRASQLTGVLAKTTLTKQPMSASKPLLLIAEDDAVLRRLLTMILEREHYRVVGVSNGAEAVSTFAQDEFDLVLLDIMMPEMDGFSACANIRKQSTVPIILLSAFSSPEVKIQARHSGASFFLNKPIRPHELKRHLQLFLPKTRLPIPEES